MVIVEYEWTAKGNTAAIEEWATRFLCHLNEDLFEKRSKTRYVNISIKYSKEVMVGWCHGDEEEVWIELGNELLEDEDYFMETLAHELVHAKQLLTGELKDLDNFRTEWKGEEYINLRDKLPEEVYRGLPWEEEAYRRQKEYLQVLPEESLFKRYRPL